MASGAIPKVAPVVNRRAICVAHEVPAQFQHLYGRMHTAPPSWWDLRFSRLEFGS